MADNEDVKNGNSPAEDENYKVGYCHPPKEHQWKKGQTGNVMGQRKAKKSRQVILEEVFDEEVTITTAKGKKSKMAGYAGVLRRLRNDGMNGNVAAAKGFIECGIKLGFLTKNKPGGEQMHGVLVVPETANDLEAFEREAQKLLEHQREMGWIDPPA